MKLRLAKRLATETEWMLFRFNINNKLFGSRQRERPCNRNYLCKHNMHFQMQFRFIDFAHANVEYFISGKQTPEKAFGYVDGLQCMLRSRAVVSLYVCVLVGICKRKRFFNGISHP